VDGELFFSGLLGKLVVREGKTYHEDECFYSDFPKEPSNSRAQPDLNTLKSWDQKAALVIQGRRVDDDSQCAWQVR